VGNVTCRGQYAEPQPWPLTVNVAGPVVTAIVPNGTGTGTISGNSVTFTLHTFLNAAHFTGSINGDTMSGTYMQGGTAAPCDWFAKAPGRTAAEIAAREELRRKQEELEFARKYPAIGPAPPSPAIYKQPVLVDRARIRLSEQGERIVGRLEASIDMLPDPVRRKIGEPLARYIETHAIPSQYGQMFWNINSTTTRDMEAVLEAVKRELRQTGQLGPETESAIARLQNNLRSNIADELKHAH
jgi:hypothetical protein